MNALTMTEFYDAQSRDWWRNYFQQSKAHAERSLERPLTFTEHKQLVRLIRWRRKAELLGSTGVTAIMFVLAIRNPDDPFWNVELRNEPRECAHFEESNDLECEYCNAYPDCAVKAPQS